MTEATFPSAPSPEAEASRPDAARALEAEASRLDAALAEVRPHLARLRRQGRVVVLGAGLGGLVLSLWLVTLDAAILGALTLIGGLAGMIYAWRHVANAQRLAIMPILAGAAGLEWDLHGYPLAQEFDDDLLPSGSRSWSDGVRAPAGDREVALAEVTVTRGSGKEQRTVFHGLGLRLPLRGPVPRLLVAGRAMTDRALGFLPAELSTHGLVEVEGVAGPEGHLGVWAESVEARRSPEARAVLEVLANLSALAGDRGPRLRSAGTRGPELHVTLAHGANLFALGGPFASEAAVSALIRRALEDLRLPFALADALLAAEQRVLAAPRG